MHGYLTSALAVALLLAAPLHAAPPAIVVTIVPVHSLVSAVTEGVTTPYLMLEGNASPHQYALKPSQARALQSADLVVWVGEALETFLRRSLEPATGGRTIITLMALPTIRVLPVRSGGRFEAHAHGPAPDPDDAHRHLGDPHIWLDADNAIAMVDAVAEALVSLDPGNATRYQDNAVSVRARIHALDDELAAALAPLAGVPYLVFHDAYQAFERRYGLGAAGAVTLNPQRAPGAARIRELRNHIRSDGIRCVFREPQFEPRLVDTLIGGTGARVGVLDPMGGALSPGPQAWFTLMRGLSDALAACLSPR